MLPAGGAREVLSRPRGVADRVAGQGPVGWVFLNSIFVKKQFSIETMWCKWCRQHVAVYRAKQGKALSCAQCDRRLGRDALAGTQAAGLAQSAAHGVELAASQSPAPPTAGYDDWKFDQSVQRLQARVGNWRRTDALRTDVPPPRYLQARQPRRDRHYPTVARRRRPKTRGKRRTSLLAWMFLAIGLTALACGSALLVWSVVDARDELWTLGIPIAVAGQVGLLLGLVLQLERVWQNGRDAVHKLDHVDRHLHHLEEATSLLNTTHGSASQAFYAHMADDASPEFLLADLKGQLDALSAELVRRR